MRKLLFNKWTNSANISTQKIPPTDCVLELFFVTYIIMRFTIIGLRQEI